MSSESPEQLSNAEKRARLAGAAARSGSNAPAASSESGRIAAARRDAARFGDETAGETPAQRRKRLALGVAGGLVVVVIVVVVIMVIASGSQA